MVMGTFYSGPSKVLQDVKVNPNRTSFGALSRGADEEGVQRTDVSRLRAESNEDFLTGVGNNFRAHAL